MESIAVIKPDMGMLSRKRPVLSPFGILSQAFSDELLSRVGFEEGHWPFIPLELLEEGKGGLPAPTVRPTVQVDLNLVLQALRRTESRAEREKITERIVERVIRMRERGAAIQTAQAPQPETAQQTNRPSKPGDGGETVSVSESATVAQRLPLSLRQNVFYSTVNQHLQFTTNLRQSFFAHPYSVMARRTAPGNLGGRSRSFFFLLQWLRQGRYAAPDAFAFPLDVSLPEGMAAALFGAAGASGLPELREKYGAYIAGGRNVRTVEPAALFYPVGAEEGDVASGMPAEDAIAVIRRNAQRIARRLGREPAARTVVPDTKRSAGMRQAGQDSAVSRAVRPPQFEFEDTSPENRTLQTASSSDGFHITKRFAQAPFQTGPLRQTLQFSLNGIEIAPVAQDIRLTGEGVYDTGASDSAVQTPEKAGKKPETILIPPASEYAPGLSYRTVSEGEGGESAAFSEQKPMTPSVRDIRTDGAEGTAAGPQRDNPITAVRDIRIFHTPSGVPAADETTHAEHMPVPFPRELSPETTVYRTEPSNQTAADGHPAVWQSVRPAPQTPLVRRADEEPIRSAAADRRGNSDVRADPRRRLADRLRPSPQATRNYLSDTVRSPAEARAWETAMAPEPLELAYGAQGAQKRPEPVAGSARPQSKPSARTGMDSDFVRSLPEWAQRFLREGAPQTPDEAAQRIGTARSISALALPEREGIVEWTAPQYPAAAPVTFRERPEQPGRQTQPQPQDVRISDAELRRVSDRVYQIVEDRIRTERRRLGL